MPEPEPTPPAPAPPADKTFSQADVDRVVADRLARERAKFADYDDVKAKATKLDETEAASQSALEKAQTAAATAEARAVKAEESLSATRREVAIMGAASSAGAVDAAMVAALLARDDSIVLGADGIVTGATDAVTALLTSKPFLATAAPGSPTPPAGGSPTPPAGGTAPPTPGGADGGAKPTGSSLTREQLKTMTPKQVLELDPGDVDRAMAG